MNTLEWDNYICIYTCAQSDLKLVTATVVRYTELTKQAAPECIATADYRIFFESHCFFVLFWHLLRWIATDNNTLYGEQYQRYNEHITFVKWNGMAYYLKVVIKIWMKNEKSFCIFLLNKFHLSCGTWWDDTKMMGF